MKINSNLKIFILLNLLLENEMSRKQILDRFDKLDISISPSLLTNYINKLNNEKFNISSRKIKNEKYYKINDLDFTLSFDEKQIELLFEIKQLIFAQKKYNYIKVLIELFYKISHYIKDDELKDSFLNFGYFSKINWKIVEELEKHCKEKNNLLLDYLLPLGGNKEIEIQAEKIKMSALSQRLYLIGILKDSENYFYLPIERIYRIIREIKTNQKIKIKEKTILYKVEKKFILENNPEDWERIVEDNEDVITIEAKVLDDFSILQRLLYYCPHLYFVSDDDIKFKLVEKLTKMKEIYAKG